MIDIPFLTPLLDRIPTYMDFEGQKVAEKIFQVVIVAFALAGLAWGYVVQQFSYTVISLGIGFIISCLLTLPPWPVYRKNPLPWQKARDEAGSSSSKSSKKKK
ncbi:signal peptidase complex subunit 1 [Rhipicephalus sanguineus]|uniref:signal peptidase complex subunit 1 n=1 Tax=Rhipicephalus sanguineus TaxID=34632 RepID=UPI0018952C2A|nr:signal peptidase complex subunit 1 [Rhipicephalus sanguineus]